MACELICQPSASSAIDPYYQPATISTTMAMAVRISTHSVRRSASGLAK